MTAKDNRLFVEAVLYRYRAGIPWRDLAERFGPWKAVHTRFSRWSQRGVWERVFKVLSEDSDNEYAMLDATIVRAHQRSAGAKAGDDQAIGRSKSGLSTKLLNELSAEALIADKAYDADERMIKRLEAHGIEAVIPPKSNRLTPRRYDTKLYKARHLIENFFQKLKPFRAIATRYNKTARNFLAAIHLAATTILLA